MWREWCYIAIRRGLGRFVSNGVPTLRFSEVFGLKDDL